MRALLLLEDPQRPSLEINHRFSSVVAPVANTSATATLYVVSVGCKIILLISGVSRLLL
jgi:hypothetical protein